MLSKEKDDACIRKILKRTKKKSNNVLPGLQPNLRLTVIALNFDAGTLALITMEGRHNDSRLS